MSCRSFGNQVALDEMLKFADLRAREAIALSRNSGKSVALQLLEYEGARLLQRNTPQDQLTALWRFWNASSEADLGTIFAGRSLVR